MQTRSEPWNASQLLSGGFFGKKGVLKVVAKQLSKTPVLESLFHKVAAGFKSATFLKKTPAQVLFNEYCEIFKNVYFLDHLRVLEKPHWQRNQPREQRNSSKPCKVRRLSFIFYCASSSWLILYSIIPTYSYSM